MSDKKWTRRGFLRLGLQGATALSAAAVSSGCGFLRNHEYSIIEPHPSWTNSTGTSSLGAESPNPSTIRVVSYNCHKWTGRDEKVDAWRIADVLARLEPDVVALQEATNHTDERTGAYCAEIVANQLGLDLLADPRPDVDKFLNFRENALMSRFPITDMSMYDLAVPGRRTRGALDVEIDVEGKPVRIVGTHFGLKKWERREQATRLLQNVVSRPRQQATVVMGDFNIWWGGSSNLDLLERYLGPSRGPSTFPSKMPTVQLDRIFAAPNTTIKRIRVEDGELAREASDHLPIWADVVV
ncbi:MAG: endonuclease/exonuclease/phosphatase family protein [Myxococcota bacterium]